MNRCARGGGNTTNSAGSGGDGVTKAPRRRCHWSQHYQVEERERAVQDDPVQKHRDKTGEPAVARGQ